MKVLELFCGTKSFSNVAKENGHEVFTIDNDPQFNPDLCKDILDLKDIPFDIPFRPDVIWASPPCQCFSVATIGKNWNKEDKSPKNDRARQAIELVMKTLEIIEILKPKFWFIENPRGMLRKMSFMIPLPRKTVTYCQYGDTRMKPTDIWTNLNWKPKEMCNYGDTCHVSAPRGSPTGTQGIKGSRDRGIIPKELCLEIIKCLELFQ